MPNIIITLVKNVSVINMINNYEMESEFRNVVRIEIQLKV